MTVERTYPCVLRVEFPRGTLFARLDTGARTLAARNSPVVLRGMDGSTDREAFLSKGREMGAITKWTFGEQLEVKEAPAAAWGSTSRSAPFHYDGVLKVAVIRRVRGGGHICRALVPVSMLVAGGRPPALAIANPNRNLSSVLCEGRHETRGALRKGAGA